MKRKLRIDWPAALVLVALLATVVALVASGEARTANHIIGLVLALLAPSPVRWDERSNDEHDDEPRRECGTEDGDTDDDE